MGFCPKFFGRFPSLHGFFFPMDGSFPHFQWPIGTAVPVLRRPGRWLPSWRCTGQKRRSWTRWTSQAIAPLGQKKRGWELGDREDLGLGTVIGLFSVVEFYLFFFFSDFLETSKNGSRDEDCLIPQLEKDRNFGFPAFWEAWRRAARWCSGIEDMLNELRDKFTDERSKLEKEEMTLHHAHQSLMQEHLGETHKFEKSHFCWVQKSRRQLSWVPMKWRRWTTGCSSLVCNLSFLLAKQFCHIQLLLLFVTFPMFVVPGLWVIWGWGSQLNMTNISGCQDLEI